MGLRKIKTNVIKLIPIIWGFFTLSVYGQKIGKPKLSLKDYSRKEFFNILLKENGYIEIEVEVRMTDIFEKVQIIDLYRRKNFFVPCHDDDYILDKNNKIFLKKKIILLNQLKEKGEFYSINLKLISKTNKKLYNENIKLSKRRLINKEKIKIKFI
jgi:hypothetical protein